MTTYISTRHLYIAPIALNAACDIEGAEPSQATDVAANALGLGEVASYEPPMDREARDLYNELAGRLAARGVTHADAEAAVETGDEEVVRRLFGYTPEELDRQYERLVALGQRAEREIGGGGPPEPAPGDRPPIHENRVMCAWFWMGACVAEGAKDFARYGKVGLVLFAIQGAVCVATTCRLEGGGWTQVP